MNASSPRPTTSRRPALLVSSPGPADRAALLLLAALLSLAVPLAAQDGPHAALDSEFGTFGDNGLPFFGQTLDARKLGEEWPTDNLTPRGLILHLGHGVHACFDPDLLRIALIWRENSAGHYLTMNGMAPGSYRQPHRKAPAGQKQLPTPIGDPLLSSPLAPGMRTGENASFEDPRAPAPDRGEPGLGPLPPERGRWIGLRLDREGPTLLYEIGGIAIEERLQATIRDGITIASSILQIQPHEAPLAINDRGGTEIIRNQSKPYHFRRDYHLLDSPPRMNGFDSDRAPFRTEPVPRLWEETVRVPAAPRSDASAPFVVDDIPLPVPNPWKRNVRPADFDFFPDGRLALVTFDGDVWIADGIEADRSEIEWRRFAGGLHEPMGLRIVDRRIVVFDRNGLVRLVDRDGNGEADYYENLSSLATQTAETREFAMGLELKPGGGFYLAKGGQVAGTRGKHNGTIVEISPDGNTMKVVATGLRQPFIGVDPQTGLLTASDQQGHWKPATPIHVVQPGDYYGFQPTRLGPGANEGREIVEPPLWIPHFVNQSGARQVWLRGARMGALNDALIHVGYNRPALFKVLLEDDHVQGAVVPLLEDFPTGLLGGRVNPKDGLLYVGGLNLWGTVGKRIRGLYRIRPTGQPSWIPREVRSFAEGLLLRFDQPLDPAVARQLASYTVDRWNYVRSHQYGSGHFKLDGEPGQESLPVSCVYLSEDRHAVFLGIPDMQPAHSLRVTYRLSADRIENAYLTVHRLRPVDLAGLGFAERQVNLDSPATTAALPAPEPSAAEGRKVAIQYGCVACHSVDGSKKTAEEPDLVVGPTWKGLFGSRREFTDGTVLKKADEVYLRESILNPSRNVTKGFETRDTGVGMPSYLGVLRDDQVESLILYIKSLRR